MKRIFLSATSPLGQAQTTVELEDDVAKKAISDGLGEMAKDQVVYGHESEIKAKAADKK